MSTSVKAMVSIDPTLLRGARTEVDGHLVPLRAQIEVRFAGTMLLQGQGTATIRNLGSGFLLLGELHLAPGQEAAVQIRRSLEIAVTHYGL